MLARRAIEQDRSNAVYQELYGMVLAALGKNEEAERHLRRAVELQPQQPDFHYNLAQFLLDRQEASGLHPFHPRARRLMEDAVDALNVSWRSVPATSKRGCPWHAVTTI